MKKLLIVMAIVLGSLGFSTSVLAAETTVENPKITSEQAKEIALKQSKKMCIRDSYKTDIKTQENFQDYDFLDEIIKQEFKNIEEKINNREIKDAIGYIVLSENGEKIFLINDYNKRISFGGYRLLEDEKGKNYYNYLKDKIKGMYKPKVNVHFIKNIKIADKSYSLFATVEYEIGSSREPDTLHNGILTRMWIKENV